MNKIQKLSHNVFCAASILLAVWLAFFAGPMQSRYINAIIFVLFAVCLLSVFAHKNIFENPAVKNIDLCFWLYMLILTVGLLFAANKQIAFNRYFQYAVPAPVLYYLFRNEFGLIGNIKWIYIFVSVLAAVVSLIAILEWIYGKNIIYEIYVKSGFYHAYLLQYRVMSTQLSPVVLGTYLVSSVPFSFPLVFKSEKTHIKAFGILCMAFIIIGIILSFTRMAAIALILISAIYFLKYARKSYIFILAVLLIGINILSCIKIFPFYRLSMGGIVNKPAAAYRLERFNVCINLLKDRPFLGIGLDNFQNLSSKYLKQDKDYYRVPENMYLTILTETGVFALLSFAFFIFFLLRDFIKLLKYEIKKYPPFKLILNLSVLGILVAMFSYEALYWTVPFHLFWIYCGIAASILLYAKNV